MEIKDFKGQIEIKLISFDTELVKLDKGDFLPRYNRLVLTIENHSADTIDDVILTVKRMGSKIGADNFDTVPIRTYDLKPGQKGKYEVMVFDPFNEKFNDIEVRPLTTDDWKVRKKVANWLNKAGQFSRRLDKV
jgi:hypothetical protein